MKCLNDYKFIINAGCSYGQMAESIKKPIESGIYQNLDEKIYKKLGEDKWYITNDKVITIDISLPSQTAQWISDSVIHTVSFLLNRGVQKENIYCFIEWTQWSRINIEPFSFIDTNLEFEWFDNKLFNLTVIGDEKEDKFLIKVFQNLGILQAKNHHNIGKIGDMVYINPTHTYIESPSVDIKSFLDKSCELERMIPEEKKVKIYLDYILKTQYFLKSTGVSYNYCFMQGSLTSWKKKEWGYQQWPESNHFNSFSSIMDDDILVNSQYQSYMPSEFDIEMVIPSIKKDFDEIDLSKVWFHESKNYRRGGLDEWCMDTFGIGSMVQTDIVRRYLIEHEEYNVADVVTGFGHHPNVNLYKLLWNDIAKDCNFFKMNEKWNDEIKTMIFEDLETHKDTENGLVLSKKYLYKKTNYKKGIIDKNNGRYIM